MTMATMTKRAQKNLLRGIFGYIAPEYIESGEVTTLADVYSFGVLMLEDPRGVQEGWVGHALCIREDVYPNLVCLFYYNLRVEAGHHYFQDHRKLWVSSMVKGVDNVLTLSQLAEMLGVFRGGPKLFMGPLIIDVIPDDERDEVWETLFLPEHMGA
ncbi:hypothetical protein NE237_030194 [Protea cynaroides]|uniref:Protein kinase domain-containing protein n=1 Tax=Protea cynaroides TaxID=273540 RepID=A0A9Q0GSK4_9MAGN|nr:hypothetical protein NE237_030194 [Protea cynaroides]